MNNFEMILPELEALRGIKQNPKYHVYDVFDHTMSVVEKMPADSLELRIAALLHDIGKASTTKVEADGQIHSYQHEVVGADMVPAILKRFGYGSDFIKRVQWLVLNHMIAVAPTRKSVNKFLRRVAKDFRRTPEFKEAIKNLLILRTADMSSGKVDHPFEDSFVQTNKLITQAIETLPFLPDALNISGSEIAEVFGEGKHIKQIQDNIMVMIQSGSIPNNHEVLVNVVKSRKEKLD